MGKSSSFWYVMAMKMIRKLENIYTDYRDKMSVKEIRGKNTKIDVKNRKLTFFFYQNQNAMWPKNWEEWTTQPRRPSSPPTPPPLPPLDPKPFYKLWFILVRLLKINLLLRRPPSLTPYRSEMPAAWNSPPPAANGSGSHRFRRRVLSAE